MDWNRIEGNWKQTAERSKRSGANSRTTDLTQINGKREQFEGKLQERYGLAKDKVRTDVDDVAELDGLTRTGNVRKPFRRRDLLVTSNRPVREGAKGAAL